MKGGALARYAHSPTKTPPLQFRIFPSPARLRYARLRCRKILLPKWEPLRGYPDFLFFRGVKTAKSFFRFPISGNLENISNFWKIYSLPNFGNFAPVPPSAILLLAERMNA